MATRKRTPVEDAMATILSFLKEDTPATVGAIADALGLSWEVVNRAVNLMVSLQDFFEAYEVEVLGGKGKKIVILNLRVDLTKLPDEVREWFIEERFFKTEGKKRYSTKEASDIILSQVVDRERTPLEESIDRLTRALILEDELSVLEISKRTKLNRRTIERGLNTILNVQDSLANYRLVVVDTTVVRRKRLDLYGLDKTRMILRLKQLYLPNLLSEKEQNLKHSLVR
jgi:predicted transcriptional regulator